VLLLPEESAHRSPAGPPRYIQPTGAEQLTWSPAGPTRTTPTGSLSPTPGAMAQPRFPSPGLSGCPDPGPAGRGVALAFSTQWSTHFDSSGDRQFDEYLIGDCLARTIPSRTAVHSGHYGTGCLEPTTRQQQPPGDPPDVQVTGMALTLKVALRPGR
jgi:hypothetical protein